MKSGISIILFLFIANSSWTQNIYVPDDNFEQALIDFGLDDVLDDSVFIASVDTVVFLDVSDKSINSLEGIEAFIMLDSLDCSSNYLTALHLESNTNLISLNAYSNWLLSIDLSSNDSLEKLRLNSNGLDEIDLANNPKLYHVHLGNNNITEIDVSLNDQLNFLNLQHCLITEVDISNLLNLTHFDCSGNSLTEIDLSNNTELQRLYLRGNNLFDLDISEILDLEKLYCNENNLTSLDLSNAPNIQFLSCGANALEGLDVDVNDSLIFFEFSEIPALVEMDLSDKPNMVNVNGRWNAALERLNFAIGDPTHVIKLEVDGCPLLDCIEVDDPAYSYANWILYLDGDVLSDNCSLGLADNSNGIKIYPNPANSQFYVEANENASYIITNIQGQIVGRGDLNKGKNKIDLHNKETGIYLITIVENSQKQYQQKITLIN